MDLQKLPEPRQVENVFVAPPPINVAPVIGLPSSSQGKKRKATGSSVHGTQPLLGAPSSHKSGCGSLMVCYIACIVSLTEFFQAENDSVSMAPGTSRDIDGGRVVRLNHYFQCLCRLIHHSVEEASTEYNL